MRTNDENARRGLTIMEMLVSVGVMSLMILAVGTILYQSQRVVVTSEARFNTDATARAVSQVISDDMRQITQQGFLSITQKEPGGPPMLLGTTAGLVSSKVTSVAGSGGFVCYGLASNSLEVGKGGYVPDILYAQRWVLTNVPVPGGRSWSDDVWDDPDAGRSYILADFVKWPRYMDGNDNDMNDLVNTVRDAAPPDEDDQPRHIATPPVTLQEVTSLWQVLADDCERLSIRWTDGTVDPNESYRLNWYGIQYSESEGGYQVIARDSDWEDNDAAGQAPDGRYFTEFCEGGAYRALWTHHDQSSWPKLVKISFVLKSTGAGLPEEAAERTFEIVCPIGQQ